MDKLKEMLRAHGHTITDEYVDGNGDVGDDYTIVTDKQLIVLRICYYRDNNAEFDEIFMFDSPDGNEVSFEINNIVVFDSEHLLREISANI